MEKEREDERNLRASTHANPDRQFKVIFTDLSSSFYLNAESLGLTNAKYNKMPSQSKVSHSPVSVNYTFLSITTRLVSFIQDQEIRLGRSKGTSYS